MHQKQEAVPVPFQIHRLPEVKKITGKSRSAIYAAIANGSFPSPVKIGPNSVGWRSDDLTRWLKELTPSKVS